MILRSRCSENTFREVPSQKVIPGSSLLESGLPESCVSEVFLSFEASTSEALEDGCIWLPDRTVIFLERFERMSDAHPLLESGYGQPEKGLLLPKHSFPKNRFLRKRLPGMKLLRKNFRNTTFQEWVLRNTVCQQRPARRDQKIFRGKNSETTPHPHSDRVANVWQRKWGSILMKLLLSQRSAAVHICSVYMCIYVFLYM